MPETFQEQLAALIRTRRLYEESNTADFILAEYMQSCLNAFNIAVRQREKWLTHPDAGEET